MTENHVIVFLREGQVDTCAWLYCQTVLKWFEANWQDATSALSNN